MNPATTNDATATLSNEDIHSLIEKHLNRFVQYQVYQKKTSVSETFQDNVRNFLASMIPKVKLQLCKLSDGLIVGWCYKYSGKDSLVFGKYDRLRMLYYNDVHNLALNTLYDQIDDRLHMYFHTVDIMMKQNFVQILPFTYNMNYEYEADLAAFHDTWNLSAKEISDIVRFNIDNTDIEEIDKTLYDQMVSFITQSLKYVTTYEHGYKSWVNDRPVKTIYHQSYDRAEHYMHTGDIYNLEPFQQPEVVMMDVDEDMDSIPDLSPPSYDMLKMDDFSWDVSAISSNEQKAVEPVDDAMIFLCKKFTGVCM